jgi:hypothetical protein
MSSSAWPIPAGMVQLLDRAGETYTGSFRNLNLRETK